jgi:hypothetical protein
LAGNLTPELRRELARVLGLPESALSTLEFGYLLNECAWTFPEVDHEGRIVGLLRRYLDGSKRLMAGGKRGLTIPAGWQDRPGPVIVPEGPSDVLALTAMGLAAVGRPSNTGGVEMMAKLLADVPADRPIVVLGEFDPKANGKWPGRDGAVKAAEELAAKLGRTLSWALPPAGTKDARAWCKAQKLPTTGQAIGGAWTSAGTEFVDALELQTVRPAPPDPTTNDQRTKADLATLTDLDSENAAGLDWLWPGWILWATLALISADGGVGKTRLAADLVRRMRRGERWPDGAPIALAADTPVMWIAADYHFSELVQLQYDFELGDEVYLNAYKSNPYSGTSLDTPDDIVGLRERIKLSGAKLVIVDTLGSATDADLTRQEEAKRLTVPLMQIAVEMKVAIILLYHSNKEGKPLGRRMTEKCRSVIQLTKPPGAGMAVFDLEVSKSFTIIPPRLRATMSDHRIDYAPAPQTGPGRPAKELEAAAAWILDELGKQDGQTVGDLQQRAEAEAGIAKNTYFRAREILREQGKIKEKGNKPIFLYLDTRIVDPTAEFDGEASV